MAGRPHVLIGPTAAAVALLVVVVAAVVLGVIGYPGREPSGPTLIGPVAPTGASAPASAPPGGRPLQIVGLGDSVTAGTACGCEDYVTGLGHLVAAQDHRAVNVDNEGEPGATSGDLIADLDRDARTRTEVRQADVVVISVGANDLLDSLDRWRDDSCDVSCYRPAVEAMADRIAQIVTRIDAGHGGSPPTILVTDYWNVFQDGEVGRQAESDGYLDWSDEVTRAANTGICRSAKATGARCVDLYAPFKADGRGDPTALLADDGDHPNAAGTALISRTVLAALDG